MKKKWNRDICKKTALILVLFGVIAGWAASPLLGADADKVDVQSLYRQAVETFRNANALAAKDPDKARELYQKTLMRFERIVREGGISNGKLYYNIGNTYFRMKDIGRAILNYRRAEQFIPNDPNLRQNLNFARANRADHIEEKQETRILKTLFFWHYDLSTGTRVHVFAAFFMLLWVFASIRIFFRRPFTVWCIAVSLLFSILFGGSLAVEHVHRQQTRPGVVIAEEGRGPQRQQRNLRTQLQRAASCPERNLRWSRQGPTGAALNCPILANAGCREPISNWSGNTSVQIGRFAR